MRIIAWPKNENRLSNPYNFLFYSEVEKRGVTVEEYRYTKLLLNHYDYLHIHWPEYILNQQNNLKIFRGLMRLAVMLLTAKIKKTQVIWTAHNLKGHEENTSLRGLYDILVSKSIDYVHCLSEHTLKSIGADPRYRLAKTFVVPHGHYRPMYTDLPTRLEARRRLNLPDDATVLLFFGQIRKYKNLEGLIRSFVEITHTDEHVWLVVAGRPNYEIDRELLEHPRIVVSLGMVDDARLPDYLVASSYVVAPYSEVTNSGTALLALSFSRPFIGPNLAAIRELSEKLGDDWMRTYNGELTAEKLKALLDRPHAPRHLDLPEHEWPVIADGFLKALRD